MFNNQKNSHLRELECLKRVLILCAGVVVDYQLKYKHGLKAEQKKLEQYLHERNLGKGVLDAIVNFRNSMAGHAKYQIMTLTHSVVSDRDKRPLTTVQVGNLYVRDHQNPKHVISFTLDRLLVAHLCFETCIALRRYISIEKDYFNTFVVDVTGIDIPKTQKEEENAVKFILKQNESYLHYDKSYRCSVERHNAEAGIVKQIANLSSASAILTSVSEELLVAECAFGHVNPQGNGTYSYH
jgi:hypothetical protein